MAPYLLGYARVSTEPQSLDQQIDALVAVGVPQERIFMDKASGARADRPGLEQLLSTARGGDTVVVTALDRLGRSLSHVLQTIEDLQQRGIVLRSLRESLDFATPAGKMMAAVFAALAEYERDLIKERANSARAAAAARGRHTGRPRALSDERRNLVHRMRANGESISVVAETLGVSRATIYRVLQSEVSQ